MSVPEDRPRTRALGPLRALLPYLRPYRGVLMLALIALLVASAAMLSLPIALRYLIDNGLSSNSTDTINQYFIAFLAAAGAFGVLGQVVVGQRQDVGRAFTQWRNRQRDDIDPVQQLVPEPARGHFGHEILAA